MSEQIGELRQSGCVDYDRQLELLAGVVGELDLLARELASAIEGLPRIGTRAIKNHLVDVHDRLTDIVTGLRKELDRPQPDLGAAEQQLGLARRALGVFRSGAVATALAIGAATGASTVATQALVERAASVENAVIECQRIIVIGDPGDETPSPDGDGSIQNDELGAVSASSQPLRGFLSESLNIMETGYNQWAEGQRPLAGESTGFLDIDELFSGLRGGHLYVVASRPGIGATAWALNVAVNYSMLANSPTLVVSSDLSETDISMRFFASEGLVDHGHVTRGLLEEGEWNRTSHAVGRLAEAPISLGQMRTLNPRDLRHMARSTEEAEGALGLIVVDGIRFTSAGMSEKADYERYSLVDEGRSIAAEYKIPIVLPVELGSGLERRQDRRPVLSDLPDYVESAADVVAFIYRDDFYNSASQDKGIAEFQVVKHRNGRLGLARLAFRSQYVRFDNLARRPHINDGAGHGTDDL